MPEEVSHGASHLGVIAHRAAYLEGGPWLDALLAGLDENRRLLATLLAEQLPEVGYRVPEGTFLAWLDFTPSASATIPAAVLRERARVALHPGPGFGQGGDGHARLNFGTSPDDRARGRPPDRGGDLAARRLGLGLRLQLSTALSIRRRRVSGALAPLIASTWARWWL